MKRITISVVPNGRRKWLVKVGGLALPRRSQKSGHELAVWLAEEHVRGGGLAEVAVHRSDGTIGPKDTYPRSSDPRRSRG